MADFVQLPAGQTGTTSWVLPRPDGRLTTVPNQGAAHIPDTPVAAATFAPGGADSLMPLLFVGAAGLAMWFFVLRGK